MEGKQYPNPPITEAVVEILFLPREDWDWTIPGRLYDRLQPDYPGKRREQIKVEIGGGGATSGIGRLLFSSADETRLVGIGPNVLSVHALAPYRGWNELRARFIAVLESYTTLTPPKAVARVSVRYINHFFPTAGEDGSVDISLYINGAPQLIRGEGFPPVFWKNRR